MPRSQRGDDLLVPKLLLPLRQSGDALLDVDMDNKEPAAINLDKTNEFFAGKPPWHLYCLYGEALQKTCVSVCVVFWGGH